MVKKKLIIMSKIVKHKDSNSEIEGYLVVDSLIKRVSYMNKATLYKNKLKVSNAVIRKCGDNLKVLFNDCADSKVPKIYISEDNTIKIIQNGLRVLEKDRDRDKAKDNGSDTGNKYVVCTADGKIFSVDKKYLIDKYKKDKKELINVRVVNGKSIRGIKQAIPIAIKSTCSKENNANHEDSICSENPYIKNLNHAYLSLVQDKEGNKPYYKFELIADSIIIPIKVSKSYKGKGVLNLGVNEKGLITKVTIRTYNKDELMNILSYLIKGVKAKSFTILLLDSNQNKSDLENCITCNVTYNNWSNTYCINVRKNNNSEGLLSVKDLGSLEEGVKSDLIDLLDKLAQYCFLEKQVVKLLTSDLLK